MKIAIKLVSWESKGNTRTHILWLATQHKQNTEVLSISEYWFKILNLKLR